MERERQVCVATLNLNLFKNTNISFYWKHDTNLTSIFKEQTQQRIDTYSP